MTARITTGGYGSGHAAMNLPDCLYERHAEWSRKVAGSFGFERDGQLWSRLAQVTQ
ncbi:hypothetical protein [Clavibacter capsici]|uniref:hypothetical protein n=1 Tax=Clavibacter capsici TaxID=1874630 RepID=UPI001427F8B6|nr:hypothetical protein [Clavibacter capsici]QIS38658.1 hypothetical protein GW572_04595 [Clavibacter capsici]